MSCSEVGGHFWSSQSFSHRGQDLRLGFLDPLELVHEDVKATEVEQDEFVLALVLQLDDVDEALTDRCLVDGSPGDIFDVEKPRELKDDAAECQKEVEHLG